jgi:hypothetical protein
MKKSIHRDSNLSAIRPLTFIRWIGSTRFLRVATALPIFMKFNICNKTDDNQKPYTVLWRMNRHDFHD